MNEKTACLNGRRADDSGFTLIELVLVLAVALTVTIIVIPFGFKRIQEITEEEAIDLFIATIYNAQSYSMGQAAYTKIRFTVDEDQTSYIAEVPGKEILVKNTFPESIKLSTSSSLEVIEFHADGNIMKSGVLTLVTPTKRVAITFQFQRGRMIIRESERVFLDGGDFNNNGIVSSFQHAFADYHTYYVKFTGEEIFHARGGNTLPRSDCLSFL